VQAFSQNPELLDHFLDEPPEWLSKIGDQEKQREYLLRQVLLPVFERFAYNKAKGSAGYLLKGAPPRA